MDQLAFALSFVLVAGIWRPRTTMMGTCYYYEDPQRRLSRYDRRNQADVILRQAGARHRRLTGLRRAAIPSEGRRLQPTSGLHITRHFDLATGQNATAAPGIATGAHGRIHWAPGFTAARWPTKPHYSARGRLPVPPETLIAQRSVQRMTAVLQVMSSHGCTMAENYLHRSPEASLNEMPTYKRVRSCSAAAEPTTTDQAARARLPAQLMDLWRQPLGVPTAHVCCRPRPTRFP